MRRLGILATLLGLLFVTGRPMIVGANGAFDAVNAQASADAVRVQYSVKKFIIVEDFIDAGGPTAQARLDTGGTRTFAALPDPGGLVLSYNTVVGLALGQGLPFDYPLYASAAHPGEAAKETADPAGAFKVSAKAGPDDGDALAQMRPSGGDALITGAVAHSSVKREAQTISASAETAADLITLGNGAVKIAGVRSQSATVRSAGRSEPETKTSLDVDLIAVNDLRIRYGDKGFEFLGNPVPAPPDAVKAALAEALKPLNLQIDVVAPETVTGGAKAAVLEIRQLYPLPAGISQLILRFGGATSAVTAEDVLPAPAVPDGIPADAGSGETTAPPPSADFAADASPGGDIATPDATGTTPAASFSAGTGFGSGYGSGSSGAAYGAGSSGLGAGSSGLTAPTASVDSSPAAPAQAPVNLAGTTPAGTRRESVEAPYFALVVAGLGLVLGAAEWSRRSAAASMWVQQ